MATGHPPFLSMPERQHARGPQAHSVEVQGVYERVVAGASIHSRYVDVSGRRVHFLEKGAGPPLVLLHGTGVNAAFFLPLLNRLEGIRAIVPDRPGQGLSDPIDLPRDRYFETAIDWGLERLRLLWAGPGGAVTRNPEAWIVETVESRSV